MQCEHKNLVEGYYGHDCADCGELVYPYGCAPWDDYGDDDWDDDDEWDDDESEWDDMPHVQPPIIIQWDLLR